MMENQPNNSRLRLAGLFVALHFMLGNALAADMEITPFNTLNQSPLVIIYGLPHDTGADITPSGKLRISLDQDYTSNYAVHRDSNEFISLDGETYRAALSVRYGISSRWEVGIDIPYIVQAGGFLDNFIIDWHNTFRLPQGGRDYVANNHLNYSYSKNSKNIFLVDQNASGLGDIAFTGGYRLYDTVDSSHHAQLALKGGVKLPTGKSSSLFGSGSSDVMLQLCGSLNNFYQWGTLGMFGSAGGIIMSRSEVLRDQHKPLAGFSTLGLGWAPNSWISFKAQLNGITPLYRDSSMAEVSKHSVMTIFGGALKLPGEYLLDIGVAEDLFVDTSPDVSFHLGLSKQF